MPAEEGPPMPRTQLSTISLAERTCRPQRVGLFGRRGVGKTTLLTMLYREAVGGRLPDLRLAAADARTAEYLADKIVQLESGQLLPATLSETDLRFHLYHKGRRVELLVKDYQGEHVALGRQEPVRDFLRDCDAVLLCLDVVSSATAADRLRAQQEVEQLVEDYLAARPPEEPHRPMALLLTKSDLQDGDPQSAGQQFDMALHALATHCPGHAVFAVSSLGGSQVSPRGAFSPQPSGLGEPLAWLVDALRKQDEARLEALWARPDCDLSQLSRCVASYASCYPDERAAVTQRQRLGIRRARRSRRRTLASAAAALAALLGLTAYDALGAYQAERYATQNADDLTAVRNNWERYQLWHPTRNLFRPASARAETEALRDLDDRIAAQLYASRLGELTRQAADPESDPEEVWRLYRELRTSFPDREPDASLERVRETARLRRDEARERAARIALADLDHAEAQADLAALIVQADRFLREHADTPSAAEVNKRRETYLRRLDEHDIDAARDYSAREPLNFHTRRERYQEYLDRHPTGAFASEAVTTVAAIAAEWDRHDYRAVRDHFRDHAGDVKELEALGRSYLAAHAAGQFRGPVIELLRWAERVVEPNDYRVVLKSGQFDKKVAWMLSFGPDLSVEIEVNGARYGPSNIVKNQYNPSWDYEFPRRVRWKLGDAVRIRVYDHDYYKRLVLDVVSEANDPVAMWMLSGEVLAGNNSLTFESDFRLPELPPAE
jgi:GTPase SAR1 family protein